MILTQSRGQRLAMAGFLLAALQTQASVQSTMPDIYSELAPAGTREEVSASLDESIDPFSGGLTISHEDLVVPGNGGLDIKIQRTYSSNNVYKSRITDSSGPQLHNLVDRLPTGLGWTMHFGKVTRDNSLGCLPSSNESEDSLNNPIFEGPDGSQQILHYNNSSQNGINAQWVTKKHWAAYCSSNKFTVISPEGLKYIMSLKLEESQPYGSSDNTVWYTTRVLDPNGNYYDIEYDSGPTDENLIIDYIDASDGRRINFGYYDISNADVRLSQVSLSGGPTWRYYYDSLSTGQGHYLLDHVTRPDGTQWQYDYHSYSGTGTAGDNVLEEVTYPYGGTTRYTYDYECLGYVSCGSAYPDRAYSLVVSRKTTGGRDVDSGTWNYDYAPNNNATNLTTVNFPDGRYVYEHYGLRYAIQHPTSQLLWRVGLLKSKKTYDGSTLEQTESYEYDNMIVSYEDYMRPPYTDGFFPFSDNETRAPRLTERTINRDGEDYVTAYQLFTDNINPHRIVTSGQVSRTTTLTYFDRNNDQNIVSQAEDEDFGSTNREIDRSYDSDGNMITEEIYGVKNTYLYNSAGDLRRRTNERGQRWDYTQYERGVAKSETHPESISISRTVDDLGGVDSETNGRNYTTDYGYDGLGRITSVDFPRGSTASISWSSTARTVTRGGYYEQAVFNGFGQPSCLRRENVYINYNYDELGRLIFESYPGSSCSASTGTTYRYDVLDRLTRMTHNDGTYVSYTYLNDNEVRVRDERANNTSYSYQSYGDPDQRELIKIESPESITTDIGRNEIGQITTVSQGGVNRTFNYNNANNSFLYSEVHPETGTTTYGRDLVGNMTSKRVGGSSTTTFTYDGLNQLTYINHPSGTPDVDMSYDDAGNLDDISEVGGVSFKDFYYDANDNLYRERQVIDGRTYNIYYTYDSLDHLATLGYPGGQLVTFNPDDLGRPKSVFPYVHDVDYFRNGSVQRQDFANGRYITNSLDSRQRQRDLDLSSGAVNLRYLYDAASNTTQITDYQNSSRTRNLGYDDINRLETASGSWGTGSINYKSGSTSNIDSKEIGTQDITSYFYSSNRLSSISGLPGGTRSYTYDDYGNIETKTGGLEYTFDDASNLKEIELANSVIRSYDYDGLKNKVRTINNGVSTIHIYSKTGQLLADHNSSGTAIKEYAYLGSKLVANVVKSGTPPPNTNENTPIPINLNQTNTNSYGWGYGNSNHKDHLIVSFDKPNTDVRFCADGLHISNSTEVRVELNGVLLGYMSVGNNKETCFDIAESQFISGINQIKFIQTMGDIWGVTNIRIGTVVMPPILFLLLGDDE